MPKGGKTRKTQSFGGHKVTNQLKNELSDRINQIKLKLIIKKQKQNKIEINHDEKEKCIYTHFGQTDK